MKQKKSRRLSMILILAAVIAAAVTGSAIAYAVTAGGEDDPLVTKSYVDQAVAQAVADAQKDDSSGDSETAEEGFRVVHLTAGQTVVCYENTQFVLRSGQARTVVPGSNGISDLTAGKDLTNKQNLTANHLMLVPRSDGRGFVARTEVYVMISGAYTIEE